MDSSRCRFLGMKYRQDIQILRAIAIILVISYHLRVPGFKNGFLGVDIFFVISGYLIASVYDQGKIRDFLKRRARRLLPAYLTVIFITLIIGSLISIPSDFRQLVQQSQLALTLFPNIFYWAQDSYFTSNNFNPLLNLWSLGVEFQFYLFFPFIFKILGTSRIRIIFLFLISIFGCFTLILISPKTAFFLLPFRLWEFLVGYFVFNLASKEAHKKLPLNHKTMQGLLVAIFISLLIIPINGFSTSPLSGHPGFASLLAVSWALIFLLIGFDYQKSSFIRKVEKLGDYSYSIYLVHFPMIVFLNYREFGGTNLGISKLQSAVLFTVLLLLFSYLLYNYIEKPYRNIDKRITTPVILLVASIFMLAYISPKLQLSQYSERDRNISNAFFDRAEYRCGKMVRIVHPQENMCLLNSALHPTKILLIGNSHADAIKVAFTSAAVLKGKSLYFWVHNDPLLQAKPDIANIVSEIRKKKIATVYLHFSSGAVDHRVLTEFIKSAELIKVSVVVLGPVPTWSGKVPELMWSPTKKNQLSLKQSYSDFEKLNSGDIGFYKQNQGSKLKYMDVARILCNPNCRYASKTGVPFYWDSNHLTLSGAHLLVPLFIASMKTD